MKARIIERIFQNGRKQYVIQQREIWTLWQWADVYFNLYHQASYDSLEEAEKIFCFCDGSKIQEKVILEISRARSGSAREVSQ
jgi:hypothetical protein